MIIKLFQHFLVIQPFCQPVQRFPGFCWHYAFKLIKPGFIGKRHHLINKDRRHTQGQNLFRAVSCEEFRFINHRFRCRFDIANINDLNRASNRVNRTIMPPRPVICFVVFIHPHQHIQSTLFRFQNNAAISLINSHRMDIFTARIVDLFIVKSITGRVLTEF